MQDYKPYRMPPKQTKNSSESFSFSTLPLLTPSRLYKIQLRTAQNEIYKAQDTIEAVDRQRYNAEKEAAKFRSKTRQLNEDILMLAAREEAWKLGLQDGLNNGRSNEESRFTEEPGEDALDNDDDSFDETTSSPDDNTVPGPPSFVHSMQNTQPSGTHPYPPVPDQRPSNPPTVAHGFYPSESIRPTSIRSGYTRPSSRQRTALSPAPAPLPGEARPPSSQSIRASENVRPVSGYTRPSSRQRATPTPTPTPIPVHLPSNRPPSSQGIHPSENVRPPSIRSGHTRPSSRQHVSPSPVPILANTRPSSPYENIRPASIRPATHTAGVVPPDNFIPSLGADNKIRIPPPFEFQRAVTPERPVSPQLATMSDSSQEAIMIPGPQTKAPQQHRDRYNRRHSSSESNSSTLSALDIINDHPPIGIGTPMSIIPEVPSVQSSAIQLPDGDQSRRQRSLVSFCHYNLFFTVLMLVRTQCTLPTWITRNMWNLELMLDRIPGPAMQGPQEMPLRKQKTILLTHMTALRQI